ncbi:MAG: cupredoxin domain-containing protein [Thermoleophilaceae bacterium]|nr:cupredoxin domain-containing protein [Thermoleophilaceae bacterium]
MNVKRIAILILLAGTLALGACGGDDDESEPAAAASGGGETVKVSATEFEFTPSSPSVEKAGTITFDVTNDGSVDHALEVEGPGDEVETDTIPAGRSAKLTVDLSKAGTYEMYCPIGNHRQMGMEGTIKVAAGGGQPAEDEGGGSDDSGRGGY